jgi:tRNA (Thr-GGU) A37 N-methylase
MSSRPAFAAARPNPVAMAVVRCLSVDADAGVLTVDAADCWDGTPLIDIKPWIATVDQPPGCE